jgi:NTE family protein
LVGVFYASGFSPEEILKLVKLKKFFHLNLLVRSGGLFTTDVFEKLCKYITHDVF